MRALLTTAGERVELSCAIGWLAAVLEEGAAGGLTAPGGGPPDVRVTVEDAAAAFDVAGWQVLTRGAWQRPGQVVITNACSSGLDLLVTAGGPTLEIVARWRPPVTVRAATTVLRARARLLVRAVLLQYPALWRSQQRGRVPLHASVCTAGGSRAVLLAGPGGAGKSTLVAGELADGAVATCDNVCVSDGATAWGLAEPLRMPTDLSPGRTRGRRMPHGRREAPWPGRVASLVPGQVVVLARGSGAAPEVAPCDPAEAARSLAAGTYMAGELRRYWGFAATLALGTGVGDIHPAVQAVAGKLTSGLPCLRVTLGDQPGAPLRELLGAGSQAGAGIGSGAGAGI
jgi:hypothetical protein